MNFWTKNEDFEQCEKSMPLFIFAHVKDGFSKPIKFEKNREVENCELFGG